MGAKHQAVRKVSRSETTVPRWRSSRALFYFLPQLQPPLDRPGGVGAKVRAFVDYASNSRNRPRDGVVWVRPHTRYTDGDTRLGHRASATIGAGDKIARIAWAMIG